VLFKEGDAIAGAYNVTAGMVRLVRFDPKGRRRVLGFSIPGDFVGTIDDDHHIYSAETAGPATLCIFPQRPFWKRIEGEAHALRAIHAASMRRLDLALDHIALLETLGAEARVAGLIVSLQLRRRRLGDEGSLVPMPMTRLDLADHLGMTISTVSRTLHRLEQRGLIGLLPRAVRIRDAVAVKSLAAG
jgi:CRP/FNR family transcriptional regulator